MGLGALEACTSPTGVVDTPLLRRLEGFAHLSCAERELVGALKTRRHVHAPGEDLCTQGEPVSSPRLIVVGWACRMRLLEDGRRQIFSFLIPGDFVCLSSRADSVALFTTAAITPMATVSAGALWSVLKAGQEVGSALADALLDAERSEELMLFDHMVRLGRLTAYERTAHLLLELQHRLCCVGLGASRFPLPLTQELLADGLGLSLVHMNRTLKQLRRDGLLILRAGSAELPDVERLKSIARYTPA